MIEEKNKIKDDESSALPNVKSGEEKKSSSSKKIRDLKIELLKNPTKKKSIKKEIARLLTIDNMKTKLEKKK